MEAILNHQHFDLLEKIILERVVFHPPFKADASMHNEACFLYTRSGTSTLYGANHTVPMEANQGVVMRCGNYLNNWAINEEGPSEAVAVHFYPEVLKYIYRDKLPEFLKEKDTKSEVTIHKVAVDHMITQFVDNLVFYFENPSLINDELIVLKVKELILLLVKTDESNQIKELLRGLFVPGVVDFKKVINKHLYEDLSVEDLAVLTNHSLSSFKRKFKSVFDDSPARYIRVKRLERAAELLLVHDGRISDICYDCGFSEISSFSRSFQTHYGISPSEYRENRGVVHSDK